MIFRRIKGKLFYIVQNIIIHVYSKGESVGKIWMFHCISSNKDEWYNEKYSISPQKLEKLIFHTLSAKGKFEDIRNLQSGSNRVRFVTFDDGFDGIVKEALPILEKYQVPFCVFVSTDMIGKAGYLSKEQLLMLDKSNLCTIGAHTVSHPKLRTITARKSKSEIMKSKLILEEILGHRVDFMAYPYGNVSAVGIREIKYAKQCGYNMAFSTIQIPVTKACLKNPYFIPRVNINEKSKIEEV